MASEVSAVHASAERPYPRALIANGSHPVSRYLGMWRRQFLRRAFTRQGIRDLVLLRTPVGLGRVFCTTGIST
jgi:hypothetical protein